MKIFLIMVFSLIAPVSVLCQSEALLAHFNNFGDEGVMSADVRAQVNIGAFKKIVSESGNPETEIQIVFYDPTALGYYVLKDPVPLNVDGYIQKWKQAHVDRNRILFLFNKDQNKYVFLKLTATQNVTDGQLPEIVCNYISEKIITVLTSTYQEAIQQGMNAILNAYDPKYKNTLVTVGTGMLAYSKYYKGYCYPSQLLYYNDFESFHIEKPVLYQFTHQETHTIWNEELPVEHLSAGATTTNYLTQTYYFNGPFEMVTTLSYIPSRNDLLFGYTDKPVFGSGSKHIRLNTVNGSGFAPFPASSLFYYHSDNEKRTLATALTKEEYVEIKDTESGNNVTLASRRNEFDMYSNTAYNATVTKINQAFANINHLPTDHPKYSFCRLKLNLYRVRSGESLPEGAIDLYYGGSKPTWCNTYARDLADEIFGHEVLPLTSANAMYDFLLTNGGPDFISVSDRPNEEIEKLISKGYIVIFSYNGSSVPEPGHIEIGYPSEDEIKTIGAGASVGIKSWSNDSFGTQARRNTVKKYLYLGHLILNYEN